MNYESFPIPLLDENKELPDKEMILARFRTALYERLARGATKTKVVQAVNATTTEPGSLRNESLLSSIENTSPEQSETTTDLLLGFDD
ncbi:MAG: hypothetical protein HUU55_12915 [Myxococcales bacterium]|nr:hypothetical protein [Myxococcales bacterium]